MVLSKGESASIQMELPIECAFSEGLIRQRALSSPERTRKKANAI